jgi:hypothetical protein
MKKLWLALLAASVLTSGSILAQEGEATEASDSPGSLCSADGLVASFAEAVAGDSLRDWLLEVKEAICAESQVAALDLVRLYSAFDDATADSGIMAQWASGAEATSQYGEESWSAQQATGEPNVFMCGDSSSAWASADSLEKAELTLEFDDPVNALAIRIHQTYYPGSITQVALIDAETGDVVPLPNSADSPLPEPCPRVFTVAVTGDDLPETVDGIVISVDQSIGGSWNEIDAVELIGLTSDK